MKQNKKTPEDLKNHLLKYKDAVIILGDQINTDENVFKVTEEDKEIYNRRVMTKEPFEFWNYYYDKIHKETINICDTQETITKLLDMDLHSTIINLNQDGYKYSSDCIDLKGAQDILKCVRCDKSYNASDMITSDFNKVLACGCGGKIKPSVLMYNEKYAVREYNKTIDSIFNKEINTETKEEKTILNTHSLIFIGVDFNEEFMDELVKNYFTIQEQVTTDEEPYYLILITNNDIIALTNYQPEFATHDNVKDSVERLVTLLNYNKYKV